MVEVAQNMWWKLHRIYGGSCGEYVLEVAHNIWWKFRRIFGGSYTEYVLEVAQNMWWKLHRICGGNVKICKLYYESTLNSIALT